MPKDKKIEAVTMAPMKKGAMTNDFAPDHLEQKVERARSRKPDRKERHDPQKVMQQWEINPMYAAACFESHHKSDTTNAERHAMDTIAKSTDRVGMHRGRRGFLFEGVDIDMSNKPRWSKKLQRWVRGDE